MLFISDARGGMRPEVYQWNEVYADPPGNRSRLWPSVTIVRHLFKEKQKRTSVDSGKRIVWVKTTAIGGTWGSQMSRRLYE